MLRALAIVSTSILICLLIDELNGFLTVARLTTWAQLARINLAVQVLRRDQSGRR